MADFLSFEFTKVAWNVPVETATQRLILLCLGRHCDAEGRAYPSADLIAEETKLNRKTVFSALKELQALGFISCEKRPNRPNANLYRILVDSTENGTTEIGTTKNGSTENGTIGSTENGTTTVPKSVREHNSNRTNNKNKEERPRDFVPEEVETGEVDLQTFADYQRARKARRAGPVTKTSWARLKREAFKSQISLQEACEMCASRGWASIDSSWESLRKQKKPATPESKLLTATRKDFANTDWTEGLRKLPDGTYTF